MLRLKFIGSNDREFTKIIGNSNERTVFRSMRDLFILIQTENPNHYFESLQL